MAGISWNGYNWLGMAGNEWNFWKYMEELEMVGNYSKWSEIARNG